MRIKSLISSKTTQNIVMKLLIKTRVNNKYILFSTKKAATNRVNIDYWSEEVNIGDVLSPVVVKYVLERRGGKIDSPVSATKHLYAIGSIITAGMQDCTIWGSGLITSRKFERLSQKRQLDVRAVRGPLTRLVLQEYGYFVPEVYGDPAILMPLFYCPQKVTKKYEVSLITHYSENIVFGDDINFIDVKTSDYKNFIDAICSSKLVISSSLHGIILAEAYGVKAILLKPRNGELFKYYDYYYSTGRTSFPIIESLDEAKNVVPSPIPVLDKMQTSLLNCFPFDLWK